MDSGLMLEIHLHLETSPRRMRLDYRLSCPVAGRMCC